VIRLILRYLRGSARRFALAAPLMMLVEVFMDLQQPSLMAKIIDVGVATRDASYVLRTGALMVAMAILGFAGGALCSVFAAKAAVSMGGELRQGLFEKLQSLSSSNLDSFTASSLVTRCTNDVMQIQSMLIMLLRGMVRTPLLLVGSVVMAFLLSPSLSLVFCFALPFVIGAIALVLWRSASLFSRAQGRLDDVNTVMRENILGIRVVKAFALERRRSELFGEANEGLTDSSVRAQGQTMLLMPTVALAMNLCVVAVLWFGGGMVRAGGLEIGKIMAFINYLAQISGSVMMAANLVINLSKAMASSARIAEVIETEPSIARAAKIRAPQGFGLEFRDVSFSYSKGGRPALRGISFRVGEGQSAGIIGATGSGKSSLAALCLRLYDPDSGQILVGGVDLRDWDLAELRRTVGLATQESLLFSGTIGGNLRFGDALASDEKLLAALADAQAADFVSALPAGLEGRAEQRGRNFSGGQRQRLSIARSLVRDSRILILDDSTSAVDLRTESRLRAALAEHRRGRTTIVIAQRVSAIMACDLIVVLDSGEISAVGSHAELIGSSDLYRGIVASQLGEEALARA
jgi:ABC-type multidrug transport system, ATPase and permease components